MIQDANFFRFLKEAIVNKHRNYAETNFHAIQYDPWIYKWARDAFKKLKTPEFLNIQNKEVLERVYLGLQSDPRLKAK